MHCACTRPLECCCSVHIEYRRTCPPSTTSLRPKGPKPAILCFSRYYVTTADSSSCTCRTPAARTPILYITEAMNTPSVVRTPKVPFSPTSSHRRAYPRPRTSTSSAATAQQRAWRCGLRLQHTPDGAPLRMQSLFKPLQYLDLCTTASRSYHPRDAAPSSST